MNTTDNYKTVHSADVYKGKIFTVRSDMVDMPDGTSVGRDVVTKDNAVAVVALNDKGQIALVHQYRHPMGEKLWELPAGLVDGKDIAKAPLPTAANELREETGYTAANWRELVTIAASPGFTDEKTTIYLAGDLTYVGRPEAVAEEADLELYWIDIDVALEWVREGRIINAHTVAGILAVIAYSHV